MCSAESHPNGVILTSDANKHQKCRGGYGETSWLVVNNLSQRALLIPSTVCIFLREII